MRTAAFLILALTTSIAPGATQDEDCRPAVTAAIQESQASRDPALAKRATQLANQCLQLPLAWSAAARWRALDPLNVDAITAQAALAFQLHKVTEGRALFKSLATADIDSDQMLADLLPLAGEPGTAVAAWNMLKGNVDPGKLSPGTRNALTELAWNAANFAAARALVDVSLAQQGDDAMALQWLARLEAAADHPAAALAAAHRSAAAAPAEHALVVGETLLDLDRVEEAHREFERLLENPAVREAAERQLALMSLAGGDFEDAKRRFAARLSRAENPGEAVLYLAAIAERQGETAAALSLYQRLAEAGAGILPRARAASLLLAAGKRAAADKLLLDWQAAHPEQSIEIINTQSELLADAGQFGEAIKVTGAALARYPGHPTLSYQRAMLLERAGRTREALRDFTALLAVRAEDPGVMNALGYTLADHNRDVPRAEKLIRDALALTPDNPAIIDSLGWVLFRRGRPNEAAELLARAYHLSRDAEIAAHWGEVLWAKGVQSEARTVWARALARDPDSKALLAVLKKFVPDSQRKP